MLKLAPGDKRATTFLAETRSEFERLTASKETNDKVTARNKLNRNLLISPVTISTEHPIPLGEFMRDLSFSTPHEFQYSIAAGAQTDVMVNFTDKPLGEVLDAALKPSGLAWEMDEKGVIAIRPSSATRIFALSSDQMKKVRTLIASGELQRAVWGPASSVAKGSELRLDESQRSLIVVGTSAQIKKTAEFLETLDRAPTGDLETRIYKIRAEDGSKIKALVNAMIAADSTLPSSLERKVYIDGSDLIVRDTPENISKTEELLLDKKFVANLRDHQMEIVNFSLVPRDVESSNPDQINAFTNRIVESVQTFLYSQNGIKAAQAEGRRMWFDTASLQMTLVDTPDNIQRVGKFIDSLPELRHEKHQNVLRLSHAVAEQMASDLAEVLGAQNPSETKRGGEEVMRRLRRGDQFTFHDLRIRLMRVEENDPNDRNDDECELSINTGTQVSTITLRELDTQFFEDYEITAEDVQPSGGATATTGGTTANRGEGTVRLRIRYTQRSSKP